MIDKVIEDSFVEAAELYNKIYGPSHFDDENYEVFNEEKFLYRHAFLEGIKFIKEIMMLTADGINTDSGHVNI